jgi:hypothetical protein
MRFSQYPVSQGLSQIYVNPQNIPVNSWRSLRGTKQSPRRIVNETLCNNAPRAAGRSPGDNRVC